MKERERERETERETERQREESDFELRMVALPSDALRQRWWLCLRHVRPWLRRSPLGRGVPSAAPRLLRGRHQRLLHLCHTEQGGEAHQELLILAAGEGCFSTS